MRCSKGFILSSVLLGCTLMGCAREDAVIYAPEEISIDFAAHTGAAVKAFSPVTDASSFRVFGLRDAGVRFIDGDIYPTSFSHFWPRKGSGYEKLYFLGVYPTSIPVSDASQSGCCRKVLDLTLTGNEDILTFATGYVDMSPSVNVYFQHVLNRIVGFSFKALHDDIDGIRIDGITMKDVPTRVSFTGEMYANGAYGQSASVRSSADRSLLGSPVTGGTPTLCTVQTDFSFLPGEYTFQIDYTIVRYGISRSYSKSASVSLGDLSVSGISLPHQGMGYTVECTLGDNITLVAIGTSANVWLDGGSYSEDF